MSKDDLLKKVEASRREFLAKIPLGAAFAAPVLMSFSMDSLAQNKPTGTNAANPNPVAAPLASNSTRANTTSSGAASSGKSGTGPAPAMSGNSTYSAGKPAPKAGTQKK